MNLPRILILGLAAVAAIAAAFLARGLLGGGTPQASANVNPKPEIAVTQVLVASAPLQPGQQLNPSLVHWQSWPASSVDSSFITQQQTPNLETALTGTVVRAPMVEGEPLTENKFVHSESAGFLAATLQPGMRAMSIPVTTETGAGGFILPNDRIDLMMTEQISDNPRVFRARVVLTNVRVLAMDQTFKQDKDQKVVLAKTATLELTAEQARIVMKAQATGPLSMALRALGDDTNTVPVAANQGGLGDDAPSGSGVTVIRFGVVPTGANGRRD